MTVVYLERSAARGDRARFDRVLGKVRDVPAEGEDRIEEGDPVLSRIPD